MLSIIGQIKPRGSSMAKTICLIEQTEQVRLSLHRQTEFDHARVPSESFVTVSNEVCTDCQVLIFRGPKLSGMIALLEYGITTI
jgi:hypothetical protein